MLIKERKAKQWISSKKLISKRYFIAYSITECGSFLNRFRLQSDAFFVQKTQLASGTKKYYKTLAIFYIIVINLRNFDYFTRHAIAFGN